MSITIAAIKRAFKYNGVNLPDPGAAMPPKEVKSFYAMQFPELTNATIDGPTEVGGALSYQFVRAVGSKG